MTKRELQFNQSLDSVYYDSKLAKPENSGNILLLRTIDVYTERIILKKEEFSIEKIKKIKDSFFPDPNLDHLKRSIDILIKDYLNLSKFYNPDSDY